MEGKMNKKTFPKGIHPPDKKELSKDFKTEIFPAPSTIVIPLHQHIGAPAEPLIGKKDRVLKGQKIGEAKGFISAPIHSSVSGTVKSVEPHLTPSGKKVISVIIVNDGEDEIHPDIKPLKDDISSYSPEEVRTAVREAGIVGLGGAAFPTSVKLSPPKEFPVDTVILNGAECEPYLTTDYRLMLEKVDELIIGAEILKETVGASKIYIGIEDNKEDLINLYAEKLKGRADFEVAPLKTKYPQGGEKMLVKAILEREVPTGGLPFHVGVLVQNVGTTYAIYETLKTGLPLIERGLTITGEGIKTPKNLSVRIGTMFKDIVEFAGGYIGTPGKLIMGGPMMGISQWTDSVPVIKATSGILVLPDEELSHKKEYPCISCNSCVDHCPMNLVPTRIVKLAQNKLFEESKNWGLLDCIECGTCSYVCPANIPLVHWIRYGKNELIKLRKKSEK
jgi:electron transport complex protein RnfC